MIYYKSLVMPHLDYCGTILFTVDKKQIKELQIVQNKFMRIMLKARYDTPVKEMLERLELLSVSERINMTTIKMLNKIEREQTPEYLRGLMTKKGEICERATRSNNEYAVPNYKKKITQSPLAYEGIKMFNDFKKIFDKSTDPFHVFIASYVRM